MKQVCHKWGLYSYIRFNTQVEEALWQEESKQWFTDVKVTGGKAAEFGESYTIKSSYLVSAVGQLNTPRWPDIPGKDDFKGRYHDALGAMELEQTHCRIKDWDHWEWSYCRANYSRDSEDCGESDGISEDSKLGCASCSKWV